MLAKQIARMFREDQAARRAAAKSFGRGPLNFKVRSIDRRNLRQLKRIVQRYGWPPVSLIGCRASMAFALLVRHADEDRAFQRRCAALMEGAFLTGQVDSRDYSYTIDRVLMNNGRAQRYGTHFSMQNGHMVLYRVEEPHGLNKRRRAVGLPPVERTVRAIDAQQGKFAVSRGSEGVSTTVKRALKLLTRRSFDALLLGGVRLADVRWLVSRGASQVVAVDQRPTVAAGAWQNGATYALAEDPRRFELRRAQWDLIVYDFRPAAFPPKLAGPLARLVISLRRGGVIGVNVTMASETSARAAMQRFRLRLEKHRCLPVYERLVRARSGGKDYDCRGILLMVHSRRRI